MQFHNWGEEPFIQYLTQHFSTKNSMTGIGDDCAVIPTEGGKAWLVTTDALVEGVHFLKDQISPLDLGYKTVAVNVSDITAMGGESQYAFLSIALPKTIDCAWVRSLIQGIKDACEQWGILLLGGDTVGSKRDLFLNLTLIGSATAETIKYRHLAKPGDLICVTGHLGDAGGGFKALQEAALRTEDVNNLIHAHFHPEPKPEHGIFLAKHKDVHSMMDLSDGLDCDLKRLIRSSQVGAIIETSALPLSKSLTAVSLEKGWDPLQLVLTGGEDYCLLFSIAASTFKVIASEFEQLFHSPLYAIGTITEGEQLFYQTQGNPIQISYKNFDHFQ